MAVRIGSLPVVWLHDGLHVQLHRYLRYMSLLIANVVPEGLIFAADRNVSDPHGKVSGRSPKIVRWLNPPLLVGYVGKAYVSGVPTHEWLTAFLDGNATDDLGALADRLAEKLEMAFEGYATEDRGTIVHLGAFEHRPDGPLPAIWYIRDAQIRLDGSIEHLAKFEPRDELKRDPTLNGAYFGTATGSQIRHLLQSSGTPLPWAGYRQSFDLGTFGQLDMALWAFQELLVSGDNRRHEPPTSIEEWKPFMEMSVRGFGAYFDAFYPPGYQVVGGGVDVKWIPWPE